MARSATVSLATLARRINENHENCLKGLGHGLQFAIKAGGDLLEAKSQAQHGEWIPWVEDNCKFALRTTQWYIGTAQRAALMGVSAQEIAYLPPDGLIDFIRGTMPPTEKSDAKPPRFEAWMQLEKRIWDWTKEHDKTFAVKWLRRLAKDIESNP